MILKVKRILMSLSELLLTGMIPPKAMYSGSLEVGRSGEVVGRQGFVLELMGIPKCS